jgi:transcriptional regulator CtsR
MNSNQNLSVFWDDFTQNTQSFIESKHLAGVWLMFGRNGVPLRLVGNCVAEPGVQYCYVPVPKRRYAAQELSVIKKSIFKKQNTVLYKLFERNVLSARPSKVIPQRLFEPQMWYQMGTDGLAIGIGYRFGDLRQLLLKSTGLYVLRETVDGVSRMYVGKGYRRLYRAIVDHSYDRRDAHRFICDPAHTEVLPIVFPVNTSQQVLLKAEKALIQFLVERKVVLENRMHVRQKFYMEAVQFSIFDQSISQEVRDVVEYAEDGMMRTMTVDEHLFPYQEDWMLKLLEDAKQLLSTLPEGSVLRAQFEKTVNDFDDWVNDLYPF